MHHPTRPAFWPQSVVSVGICVVSGCVHTAAAAPPPSQCVDYSAQPLPVGHELVFSRDSLQHIPMHGAWQFLNNVRASGAKWLLVGSYVTSAAPNQDVGAGGSVVVCWSVVVLLGGGVQRNLGSEGRGTVRSCMHAWNPSPLLFCLCCALVAVSSAYGRPISWLT